MGFRVRRGKTVFVAFTDSGFCESYISAAIPFHDTSSPSVRLKLFYCRTEYTLTAHVLMDSTFTESCMAPTTISVKLEIESCLAAW